MKKNILFYLFFGLVFSLGAISCSEDDLSDTSVIKDSQKEENAFDRWILENYVKPYNIDFRYRYEDIESNLNYYLVPAEYDLSIKMAKLMKYLCIEVYDEVTGSKNFIKSYYPKMIQLIGSAAYQNNGDMILGTAEGGLKITMYYVNQLQMDPAYLNYYYFKTMHHEFGHILNQTKPYSTDFDKISGPDYVSDTWSSKYPKKTEDYAQGYNVASLQDGFISPYASKEASEDFVELVSIYVTNTTGKWNEMMTIAGTSGSAIIKQKFEIVYNYMMNSWNIDLNELRDVIQARQAELSNQDFETLD